MLWITQVYWGFFLCQKILPLVSHSVGGYDYSIWADIFVLTLREFSKKLVWVFLWLSRGCPKKLEWFLLLIWNDWGHWEFGVTFTETHTTACCPENVLRPINSTQRWISSSQTVLLMPLEHMKINTNIRCGLGQKHEAKESVSHFYLLFNMGCWDHLPNWVEKINSKRWQSSILPS